MRPCLSTTAPRLRRSRGFGGGWDGDGALARGGGASESEVDAARWPRGPSSACWRSRALASAAAARRNARSASSAALGSHSDSDFFHLTVRGTQALVSFAPLAFKLFYAARQNAVLRRSPFPSDTRTVSDPL